MLAGFCEYVSAFLGLQWPEDRRKELVAGILRAAGRSGFADAEEYLAWLMSNPPSPEQIGFLAGFLTVGETYFFRDPSAFLSLEERILPDLIRSRRESGRRLKIWSAGCCSGEEPYSIAILLSRMIPDWKDWEISLLATDLNPEFLNKASAGIYGKWSFRETPAWVVEGFFKPVAGNLLQVIPETKRMVTFAAYNLAQPSFLTLPNGAYPFDLVFCRNVLMYFTPERMQAAIGNLRLVLADTGLLIVSPSEASQAFQPDFQGTVYPGAIVYRKRSQEAKSQSVPAVPSPAKPPPMTAPPHEHQAYGTRLDRPATGSPGSADGGPSPSSGPSTSEAENLSRQGRYQEAIEKLSALLRESPGSAVAMALLARAHANLGHLREALEWCAKYLEGDPMNAGLHYLRATILLEQGDYPEAGKSLERALYIDPGFILGHLALASLARRQGPPEKATGHFQRVLSLLRTCQKEELIPEADGLTAGELMEIVQAQLADRGLK